MKIYARWGHTLSKLSSASIQKILPAVKTEVSGLLLVGGVGNKLEDDENSKLNGSDSYMQDLTANVVTFTILIFEASFVNEFGLFTAYEVHEWIVDITPEIQKTKTSLNLLYYHHSFVIPSQEDPTEENILIFGGLKSESDTPHNCSIISNSNIFMLHTSSSRIQMCRIAFETQTSSCDTKIIDDDCSMEDLSPFMYDRLGTASSLLSNGNVLIIGGIHPFRGNPFSSNYIGMDLLQISTEKKSMTELPSIKISIRRIDTNRIFYYGSPLVHHTLAILPNSKNSIYLLGGGVVCGGFEILYCSTKRLFLQDLELEIDEFMRKTPTESSKHSIQGNYIDSNQDKHLSSPNSLCILVTKESVKRVKTTLEKLGLYDKSYNISNIEDITIPDITKQEILVAFRGVNDHEENFPLVGAQNVPKDKIFSRSGLEEEIKNLCLYALPIIPEKERYFNEICNTTDERLGQKKDEESSQDVNKISDNETRGVAQSENELVNLALKGKCHHILRLALPSSKVAKSSLSRAISGLLNNIVQQLGISPTNNQQFPKKMEILGEDVLLIQPDDFQGEWSTSYHILFPELAKINKVSRVARSSRIKSNGIRESAVELLFVDNMRLKSYWREIFSKLKNISTSDFIPDEIVKIMNGLSTPELSTSDEEDTARGDNDQGWIRVRENGIQYYFNFLTCMFSSGNVTEKRRYANFNCDGEVVVDLYAGIGYYTLPLLIKGKAQYLYACEWNPEAIKALKFNLVMNNIPSNRYMVLEGDNRLTTQYNDPLENESTTTFSSLKESINDSADRISLGLLPSSKPGLSTAIRLLKRSGGWMHVHENVKESSIQDFAKTLVKDISLIAKGTYHKDWEVECRHIEKVKSYAPRIIHVVFDIFCAEKKLENKKVEK